MPSYANTCRHSTCQNTSTTRCDDCHTRLCGDHAEEHRGEMHGGPYCDGCGYQVPAYENVDMCLSCSETYCQDHADIHSECNDRPTTHPSVIGYGREANTSYLMLNETYDAHPLARGQRAATVELEVEYNGVIGTQPNDPLYLHDDVGITHDGSLENGIEVTLPPTRGKHLVDIMTETCDALYDHGYNVEPSCGMHVHIDLRDKRDNKEFLSHLFNTFFAFEDVLFAMQNEQRHYGSYSIPLRDKYKFYDMYGQNMDKFDFTFYGVQPTHDGIRALEREKETKYGYPRYAAFNFHSVYYRGSLEIRLHEGCIDPVRALKFIDVLQYMIARVDANSKHSYKFMARMAQMDVTKEKVAHFNKYFKLPADLVEYVDERISGGQGYAFRLPHPINWGTPKRGRPTAIRPPRMQRTSRSMSGRQARCGYCSQTFRLGEYMTHCPMCYNLLYTRAGIPNFIMVPTRMTRRSTVAGRARAYSPLDALGATQPYWQAETTLTTMTFENATAALNDIFGASTTVDDDF